MKTLPVADTEFVFGMRSSDSKHEYVRSILEELERAYPDRKKELTIPPLALFEVVIVCMSQGKGIDTIIETLEIINDIISRYKLGILEFNTDQVVKGLAVYGDFKTGFFDSLMAGLALAHDSIIIGDDEAFLNIAGLKRKTFRQYLEELRNR